MKESLQTSFNSVKTGIFVAVALLFTVLFQGQARSPNVVPGFIMDAKAKNTISAVSVVFAGTTDRTSAEAGGEYTIKINENATRIQFSFIGYKTIYADIVPSKEQEINI